MQYRENERKKAAIMLEQEAIAQKTRSAKIQAFATEKNGAMKVLASGTFRTTSGGQLLFDGPVSLSRRRNEWITVRMAEAEALRKQHDRKASSVGIV